jgi:hypothetical protein
MRDNDIIYKYNNTIIGKMVPIYQRVTFNDCYGGGTYFTLEDNGTKAYLNLSFILYIIWGIGL